MSFQATSQSIDVPQVLSHAPSQAVSRTHRMFFIDHLRVLLTMLVIMHHLAVTYSALSGWYYQEPTKDLLVSGSLTLFLFFNQSFFMGLFFLLSAYFTPGSYERKGPRLFLKDRFLRLGLPLVIFTFVLNPLTGYIGAGAFISPWQLFLKYGAAAFGPGPLWFLEALLLFDCLYVLWRWVSRNRVMPSFSEIKPFAISSILLFIAGLTVISFLVWFVFPFGWTVPLIDIIPSNFPQYIALFIVGLFAARHDWFMRLPTRYGKVGFGVALGSTVVLLPLSLVGIDEFVGGMHWQALTYNLWEAIMVVGMSMGLLVLFRQRFNRQGRIGRFLAANAYAVYVIHAPVIVCLALALRGIHIYPLLKFSLAVVLAIPLCFGCVYLLRKLSFVRAVL